MKMMNCHFNALKQLLYIFGMLTLFSCQHEIEVTDPVLDDTEEQQIEEKHPIDLFLTACLADTNNYTTMGMTQCTVDAYELWEQRLDSISGRLRQIIPAHIRADFERSQRKWEEYAEAQQDFSDELFSQMNGTMYIPIRVNNHLEVLRERVLLLEAFLREAEMLVGEEW
jgi:hypothetical protein